MDIKCGETSQIDLQMLPGGICRNECCLNVNVNWLNNCSRVKVVISTWTISVPSTILVRLVVVVVVVFLFLDM